MENNYAQKNHCRLVCGLFDADRCGGGWDDLPCPAYRRGWCDPLRLSGRERPHHTALCLRAGRRICRLRPCRSRKRKVADRGDRPRGPSGGTLSGRAAVGRVFGRRDRLPLCRPQRVLHADGRTDRFVCRRGRFFLGRPAAVQRPCLRAVLLCQAGRQPCL